VASLEIEQRLLHYFVAMGAREAPSQEAHDASTLSFQLDEQRLSVTVLNANGMIQRNRIIETLLHVSSLRSPGTQLYVAAPKLLGATLDAQIFRSYGIGLLLFDDRRIEETIKPRIIQAQACLQPSPTSAELTLLSELATLKSRCAEMEKNMERMMTEFTSLRENAHSPVRAILQTRAENALFESMDRANPPFSEAPGNSLPSFFMNNPWLDVLSKRGRSEVAPFAG